MDRRTFLYGLTLGTLSTPLITEGQDPGKVWRMGFLAFGPRGPSSSSPLDQELRRLGYVEGQNLVVEYRHVGQRVERYSETAGELVRLNPDVIVVQVCGAPLNAARRATSTIPIVVMACNDDMVATGVVASLSRPGGNVTGLSKLSPELAAKRLELLKEALPRVSTVAVLWNPGYSDSAEDWAATRAAAHALGVKLLSAEFRQVDELEGAFSMISSQRAHAFIMFSDFITFFFAGRVAELAARYRLPAMYAYREIPAAGGLMSYGPSLPDMFRRAAHYVDKILKGAKPGDLPVEQPNKFELVINLKTAKALGLTIPPSLLQRADQVIE